jgi:hypothetical protein
MSKIEDINFEFVGKGGKVKMIAWGKDYLEWDVNKRVEFSEALASALNEALELMQNERNTLLVENKILLEQLSEAETAVLNQRNNNINSITKANSTQQELIKRIRELENGNNNSVGN